MVVDPVGRRQLTVGELAGFHFPDDDGAGVDEELDGDGRSRSRWIKAVEGSVTITGADAGHVVDVFDADADAC